MKLYATVTTTRGKRKGVGDDNRILVELSHGNTILGTIGLYDIKDDTVEGYRIVWRSDDTPTTGQVLKELETTKGKKMHDPRTCENSVPCLDCEEIDKGKKQKGVCGVCGVESLFNPCQNCM